MAVITQIIGGLGNQMFQYSMGRAIAERTNELLFLRVIPIGRAYMLDKFNITVNNPQMLSNYPQMLSNYPLTIRQVQEPHFHYSPWLTQHGNCLLTGYWQSEKYFKDIRPTLLNEFTLKMLPSTFNNHDEDVLFHNSVCIHARRGDYLGLQHIYASLSMDYYKRAIERMDNILGVDKDYYIFSDDWNWCDTEFIPYLQKEYPNKHFFHGEKRTSADWETIKLMSACQHFIIANSTFSWWGAWLSQYPGKVVICPEKWFSGKEFDIKDLYPDEWIKMPIV